ncbi:MAG: erythromycin esterase family protein [Sciscionella sp.]
MSEYYRLKDRVLPWLVSELGFSAFVMESGFPEGLAVNDWVLGGAGDLEQVADTGITYAFGECAEMRAQLRWMRDWNAQHEGTVRFDGIDAPGSVGRATRGDFPIELRQVRCYRQDDR